MNEKLKNAFDSIHAQQELKDSTIDFIQKKREAKISNTAMYKRLATAVACVAFVAVAIGGYFSYFTQVSAISLDINPSIELGINRFDRVVFVEGFNNEGVEIAEKVDVRFMDYTTALKKLFASESVKKYMDEERAVSVTVTGRTESDCDEIIDNVEKCELSGNENLHCYKSNDEQVSQAHEENMSFGKYNAYLILKELDSSITPEEVQSLTMKQIREMIDELSGEADVVLENDNGTDGSCDDNTKHHSSVGVTENNHDNSTHHESVQETYSYESNGNGHHSSSDSNHNQKSHH